LYIVMAVRLTILFLFFALYGTAQKDSVAKTDTLKLTGKKQRPGIWRIDTAKPYSPRIAIVRSAVLPGWGQITNKKYWKLPIVYGALGTTGYIFFRNINQYKEANAAFKNANDGNSANDFLIPEPYYSVRSQPERIRNFRNQVRQNVDYTVLFFIVFWGLNVVDAAVDAHLKTFDVSDKLSLEWKPGYSPMANTSGMSLLLHIGKHKNTKNIYYIK
jgi:hypothetical protein